MVFNCKIFENSIEKNWIRIEKNKYFLLYCMYKFAGLIR